MVLMDHLTQMENASSKATLNTGVIRHLHVLPQSECLLSGTGAREGLKHIGCVVLLW